MSSFGLDLPGKVFRRSAPGSQPLRVGLRLDGPTLSAWAEAVVQDLLLADFVEIVDVHEVPRASWWLMSASSAVAHLLFRCLDQVYRLKNDPLARRRLPPSLGDRRSDEPIDVYLDLSTSGGEWYRPALHGVWALQLGEPLPNLTWPPFGPEMLRDEILRRVDLQQHLGSGLPPKLLCRADFQSDAYPSVRSNLIGPLWGASHFFLQKLNELHRFGSVTTDACAAAGSEGRTVAHPRLRDVFAWLLRQATKRMPRLVRPPVPRSVWRLAIRRSTTFLPDSPTDDAIRTFRWMDELGGCPAADPFLFKESGKLWLFFESIDRHSGHGHIACGWLDDTGRLHDERAVLKASTHLSYPHLLRDGGEIYMLPESAESGGLDLYRARRFPDEWEKVGRLLDFPCVDSTVFQHEGAWWMFTSPMATGGAVALTWLFKAERLEGPWEYQVAGPAACSALSARAAGDVFELHGRLVRPSQDCGRSYGRAIVFNEILALGSGPYHERTFCRLESKTLPGLVGLHTYNRVGDWEVIDGLFADGP